MQTLFLRWVPEEFSGNLGLKIFANWKGGVGKYFPAFWTGNMFSRAFASATPFFPRLALDPLPFPSHFAFYMFLLRVVSELLCAVWVRFLQHKQPLYSRKISLRHCLNVCVFLILYRSPLTLELSLLELQM